MAPIVLAILKPLLPVIVAPIATAVIKWGLGKLGKMIPAAWQPVVSAIAGAVLAATTGDVSTIATTTVSAVEGAVGGAAGSKVRDIVVGKPNAAPTAPGPYTPPWAD